MMMSIKPQPEESEILRFWITLLCLRAYRFVMMGKCISHEDIGACFNPKKLAMPFLSTCRSTWVTWLPCHVATSLYLGSNLHMVDTWVRCPNLQDWVVQYYGVTYDVIQITW